MRIFRRAIRPSEPSVLAPFAPAPPAAPHPQVHVLQGSERLAVVGESFYRENLWRIVGGRPDDGQVRFPVTAVLSPDPTNPYDSNAVSVWVDGLQVGHLARADAGQYQRAIIELEQRYGCRIGLTGSIVGGGMREDGPGSLGVFLLHNRADFGLADPHLEAHEHNMRTGLSDAFRTDRDDDTYDIAWVQRLPTDTAGAITMLRHQLTTTTEAISRHFAFCELEARLYHSRDSSPSALDEYDAAVKLHDAEMETICAAFVAKWGKVPLLETYKQMCVRQAKAHEWDVALSWAERGITVYGEAANREENVLDLRKRAEFYRLKLDPPPKVAKKPQPRAPRAPTMQVVKCSNCGVEWQRERRNGRPPKFCLECAGG